MAPRTTYYQDVTDNLNEHWGTELAMRTVKERFFLLVKKFKTADCEYRNKSRGNDEYTEHKQLLQDITDAIESAKKTKRAGKKAKPDRLELSGEIQVVRASQVCDEDETGTPTSDASSDAVTGSVLSSTGLTTAQVSAAVVAFIAQQSKRHDDELQLRQEELRFKKAKAEKEEARWKEEFEFRKRKAANNAKRWLEEVELRRNDMKLRREELAILK